MEKINIALLAGGWSGERDISIKSGEAVYNALDKKKYSVTRYDPRDDLASSIQHPETRNQHHHRITNKHLLQNLTHLLSLQPI